LHPVRSSWPPTADEPGRGGAVMICTKNRFGDVLYERGDPELDDAWDLLMSRKYKPGDWMYMYSRPAHGGCPMAHYFKHISTREYLPLDVTP